MEGKRHLLQKQETDRNNAVHRRTGWLNNSGNGMRMIVRLFVGIFLLVGCGSYYETSASEFGGFDISTGTGEFEGDWSDWEDESTYDSPDYGSDTGYTDKVRNDGQEINQSTIDSTTTDRSYNANESLEDWSAQNNSGSAGSGNSFYDQNYAEGNDTQGSHESRTENGTETTQGDVAAQVQIPIALPTNTPTPVPTPTSEPTNTPTPAFTEVPQEEVNTVTEYKEEYDLPPAECLRKMRLFCWKETLPGGTCAEIQLNENAVQNIMSVQINGQEKEWQTETITEKNGKIKILKVYGLSEEKNDIKLALMLPVDLTWTGDKKNVILTYTILKDKR